MPKKLKLDGKFAHAQSGNIVMYVVQDKQHELEIDFASAQFKFRSAQLTRLPTSSCIRQRDTQRPKRALRNAARTAQFPHAAKLASSPPFLKSVRQPNFFLKFSFSVLARLMGGFGRF